MKIKVKIGQVILGNGSDELLLMSVLAFCHPGDEIIHAKHGFEKELRKLRSSRD